MKLQINQLLYTGRERLRKKKITGVDQTARALLGHVLKMEPARLIAEKDKLVTRQQARVFYQQIAARCRYVPVQYLLGHEEFMELSMAVGEGVLIPRPETELLAREGIRRAEALPTGVFRVADLGTGSGCLAIILARHFPAARVEGVDVSAAALQWARVNRRQYRVSNLRLTQRDARQPFPRAWRGVFDLVVTNPPYIASAEWAGLQPEVRREPRRALLGGRDGLGMIRVMIRAAGELLRIGGVFSCEMGYQQSEAVQRILHASGYSDLEVFKDHNAIPRIITAVRSLPG